MADEPSTPPEGIPDGHRLELGPDDRLEETAQDWATIAAAGGVIVGGAKVYVDYAKVRVERQRLGLDRERLEFDRSQAREDSNPPSGGENR